MVLALFSYKGSLNHRVLLIIVLIWIDISSLNSQIVDKNVQSRILVLYFQ